DDTVPPAIGLGLDETGDVGKERVGNIFYDQTDNLCLSGSEAFCQLIWLVTDLLDVCQHPLGQSFTDTFLLRLSIQNKRYGGNRHPEILGNVTDKYFLLHFSKKA